MVIKYPDFQIPETINYLSDVISELPHNGMYNKILTGSGGTTIAINSKENYVICVPYVSLIENKCHQHSNLFGVYEKFKVRELKEYLANDEIPFKKFIVTYDSLPTLIKYIDPTDYKILVDEVHCLFQNYVFRNRAVKRVLDNYEKFKSYCFMTATLLEKQFTIKELVHLPIYESDWAIVKEVTVHSVKCDSNVINTISYLIDEFLTGKEEGNAHIFINSVTFIKNLIKHCNLTDDNCRAIWSLHNKTPMPISRSLTTDEPKKINFYTSTMFEGCDVKDENGKIFIVSDGTKAHSVIDISTSLKQIAGRIRKTKYWDTIYHIYQTTRYNNNVSFEDFKKSSLEEVDKAKKKADKLNELPDDEIKDDILRLYKKEMDEGIKSYLSIRDGKFIYDENILKLDLYNYKVTKCLYKLRINLSEEYKKIGLTVSEEITDKTQLEPKHIVKVNPKDNFIDTIHELEKGDSDFILWAYKQYPFLSDAVSHLGIEKIKELNYSITNIKRHLNNQKYHNEYDRIRAEFRLYERITEGTFLTLKELKELTQKAYKHLHINKVGKASDIEKYFKVVKTTKRIKDKTENGYNILSMM